MVDSVMRVPRLPGISDATPGAGESRADGFRGPQVCALIGITYRQLDYWARTGLLRPSIADARGSGTQRVYAYTDVVELKVIKQLLDAGISLQRARRAVECLRNDLGADLASSNLVLVPLSGVLEELDAAILQIERNGERDKAQGKEPGPPQRLGTAVLEARG
jgi:DNA-binding transcriptional MerR regulator